MFAGIIIACFAAEGKPFFWPIPAELITMRG
jgi:hypothetical protein